MSGMVKYYGLFFKGGIFFLFASLGSVLVSAQVQSVQLLENGMHGGGFQSGVAVDPTGRMVYSAGDVSGVHASVDGGRHFSTLNKGLRVLKVASITLTPDNPEILYAATGDKGNNGALNISTDGGESWRETGDGGLAHFAGNHSDGADVHLPSSHPRSNGNLITVITGADPMTESDDLVVVGTYKDGVKVFSGGGETLIGEVFPTVGNTQGGYVRAIASHPTVADTVYAAIYFSGDEPNGVYEIDISTPSSPEILSVYETAEPEEVVVLENGNVYAAIGAGGIAGKVGGDWSTLNNGLLSSAQYRWAGIDGYSTGNGDVLYATVNNSNGSSGSDYSSVWRSVNGGADWSGLVDSRAVARTEIYNGTPSGGDPWWLQNAFGNALLGRRQTALSSITILPHNDAEDPTDDLIYVSGRGGLWKSENGGQEWWPAIRNMQVTANRGITVHPDDPSIVMVGNTDFVVMASQDRLSTVARDKPASVIERGYDILIDPISEEVIVGAGDRDININGEVYVKAVSEIGNHGSGWSPLGLASAAGGKLPQAVAFGYHDGSGATSRTILASVQEEGIFRLNTAENNGNWEKVTTFPVGKAVRSRLHWPDPENSGVVYLLDTAAEPAGNGLPTAGLFRSTDGGKNWENMWPGMAFRNNDFYVAGFLAGDTAETLYLSAIGESGSYINRNFRVYRLNNADTETFGNPVTDANIDRIDTHSGTASITRPGSIHVDGAGRLWLTQQSNPPNHDAGLYLMENPETDSTFKDLTTLDYQQAAVRPTGIEVSSDGLIYLSQDSVGALRLFINPETDSDGDGVSNVEEFISQTDPEDPASALCILSVESTPAGQEISALSQLGRRYFLDYSEDLSTWEPLQSAAGTGSIITLTDPDSSRSKMFYRLRVED